jgi:hypothetical protein
LEALTIAIRQRAIERHRLGQGPLEEMILPPEVFDRLVSESYYLIWRDHPEGGALLVNNVTIRRMGDE